MNTLSHFWSFQHLFLGEEWVRAQKADPTLSDLLENVFPGDVRSAAHGYFLQKGLLMRKWVPRDGDFW